jgi:hypothetical protein
MPFKDPNPNADPDARYKAVGSPRLVDEKTSALFAFQSPDGVEWERLDDDPIIPSSAGSFDSPNVAFWDPVREEYRAYFRYFAGEDDRRAIATATSPDFRSWSDPVSLSYADAPPEQLYTNCVRPYHRAPHLFVGFPARYVKREWTASTEDLPGLDHRRRRREENERFGTALTDTLLMTSRDGARFERWPRAFVPPGLWETDSMANWAYGDNYVAWYPVETESRTDGAPPELSLYATENHWNPEGSRLRRYTLRLDGFVSVQADRDGGEFVTPPLRFDGSELRVNAATSAGGSLSVELLDGEGTPIDGATLSDSVAFFGDSLDATVRWERGADVSHAAGRPVRLRFVLADADLYSFRFV